MKYVAFYDVAPEALPKLAEHFPAHRARLDEFHARGELIAAGPLGAPPTGAMAIFSSREAADAFIRDDPFVVHGLVSASRVVEWRAVFL
ncbi:MAG TPA: YciI family protein [Lacunisphaera sp.]